MSLRTAGAHRPVRRPTAAQRFAEAECGGAQFYDTRRRARYVDLAATLTQAPTVSLPEACRDAAQVRAASRFFGSAAVTPQALLAPHQRATQQRLAAAPLVLALNDTTLLDYTAHPATRDLGPLTDVRHQGELVHGTLAVLPDQTPLGVLEVEIWTRDPATFGALADAHTRPIAEKESAKWLHSLAAVNAVHAACPDTTIVCVGDREADVYDLFIAAREPGVELLVRAAQNRRVEEEPGSVFGLVAQQAVLATTTVAIPAQRGRRARTATVAVRCCAATLRPPKYRAAEHLPPVTVWAVAVTEVAPPSGVPPLSWRLLTTVPTETAAEALARVAWYRCRWLIEVWHKVLKSGCQIEQAQLGTQAALAKLLVVYALIAWRVLCLTYQARASPGGPCTVVLSPLEWQALWCQHHGQRLPPPTPPSLREAARWVGQLGGFLGRKADGEPGVTVIWRGLSHLSDLAAMYALLAAPASSVNEQL